VRVDAHQQSLPLDGCNRLEVICHEDLDTLAAPWVVPFVSAALAQSRDRYSKSIGEARLMVGNAIRMMCRAPKSRAGCHFAAAIGLRSMLEDFAPTIPDYALDMHTMKARRWGAVSTISAAALPD
jgi:replication-associated recombination protein RarA